MERPNAVKMRQDQALALRLIYQGSLSQEEMEAATAHVERLMRAYEGLGRAIERLMEYDPRLASELGQL